MEKTLHSIYLRHDTSTKSLTKRVLAQILLKIIYLKTQQGITIEGLRNQVLSYTGVKFTQIDLNKALTHLVNNNKINSPKFGKYFINERYKDKIKKEIDESLYLNELTIKKWFGKSETYQQENGNNIILDWFQNTLIEFFKIYSYEWIKDLSSKKNGNKKKKINIENILNKTTSKKKISPNDIVWLKSQFQLFLESNNKDDIDLLWIYGSSMFASALLTAKNYADDFSMETFKNSKFILDTNVLLILELEGYEKSYAIKEISKTFKRLDIQPRYFYISREEYIRAIGPKKEAVINSVDKFGVTLLHEMDCAFVQTALKRQCKRKEDFERFFEQIMDIPKHFGEDLELKCEDYAELKAEIENGENDIKIKQDLNKIHRRKFSRDKREKPMTHDAGLLAGASFLRQNKKTWILTRDSSLREYGFEKSVRDEMPLTVGLDSLIQLLSIESGGTERESNNFAPLFSRLIKSSLIPEKETFQPEDLDFILKTRIQISELEKIEQIKLAKTVNRLRLKNTPDEDITLEIQRHFQRSIKYASKENEKLKGENFTLSKTSKEKTDRINTLKQELFREKYHSEIKVANDEIFYNWVKLAFLFIAFGVMTIFVFFAVGIEGKIWTIISSFLLNLMATLFVMIFGFKSKLYLTQKDKSTIEKEVKRAIDDSVYP